MYRLVRVTIGIGLLSFVMSACCTIWTCLNPDRITVSDSRMNVGCRVTMGGGLKASKSTVFQGFDDRDAQKCKSDISVSFNDTLVRFRCYPLSKKNVTKSKDCFAMKRGNVFAIKASVNVRRGGILKIVDNHSITGETPDTITIDIPDLRDWQKVVDENRTYYDFSPN